MCWSIEFLRMLLWLSTDGLAFVFICFCSCCYYWCFCVCIPFKYVKSNDTVMTTGGEYIKKKNHPFPNKSGMFSYKDITLPVTPELQKTKGVYILYCVSHGQWKADLNCPVSKNAFHTLGNLDNPILVLKVLTRTELVLTSFLFWGIVGCKIVI